MANSLDPIVALGNDISLIDTALAGEPELSSVYLIEAREPALVEAGAGAGATKLTEALDAIGVGPTDLAHIIVSHVHLDHAGGAGELAMRYPSATVWAHERGVRHLAHPARLIASTTRTYGQDRMERILGRTRPVPPSRLSAVTDGSTISLGDRSLDVLETPGHASHHIALAHSGSGAVFTGEAIGCHLPWADTYRPALPPPEVDVALALASVERIRSISPTRLLASHFGPIEDPQDACERAGARIRSWSEAVRVLLEDAPDLDIGSVTRHLEVLARQDLVEDGSLDLEHDIARYDILGSIRMNAAGLSRYWQKRREANPGA
jgi:glyoxylase-like metal-dependent hydrolase (beta-lactamase superfamily II)